MPTPTQPTPDHVLAIARIAQMLAQSYAADQSALNGNVLDSRLGTTIYNERMALQNLYSLAPNSVQLQGVSNYVYSILGVFASQAESIYVNQAGAVPSVTGPANQSVSSGALATFTINVVSALPYSVQWYKNGSVISGQTTVVLSFTTSLGDSGSTYYALVQNAAGTIASATASLSVSNPGAAAYYYYGSTDYFTDLNSGVDNITYDGNVSITPGSPISIPFPVGASNNQFNVVKYSATESDKITWVNSPLNAGSIPDSVYRTIVSFGGFKYIISRNAMSLDPTLPVIYS